MRALVTGASGFVGRHLATLLRSRGDEVVAASRAEADVRDAAAVRSLVAAAAPDAVFHLAGQSSVARSFADPVATFEANAVGTVAVLEAVRATAPGARVLVASSADVYGAVAPDEPPVRETRPLAPASPYAASKAAAETAALQYARSFGLDAVVVRSFSAVGPGQSTEFALPGFAAQLARVARGEAEPVLRVGNLSAERDFVDVVDVARAYAALAGRGATGEAYNVCTGEGRSLRDALDMLVRASGLDVRIELDPARLRPVDVPRLAGSSEKLRAATGWRPERPLAESLAGLYRSAARPA